MRKEARVRLRYNYRLYPDASQRQALARLFGCVRVVWNDALAMRKAARKAGLPWIGGGDLQKICITVAKRTPEREWLMLLCPVKRLEQDLFVWWAGFSGGSVSGRAGVRCIA
ncbi:helix-turn-helix domain-containing protein [Acrocarpospora sp. B8E8]|uniref:helix-turn-helix domain-containing protein n=1 Tax=Acrocarpospora sp. B8E8 TaxID=3153572 RepID=UPI00325F920D